MVFDTRLTIVRQRRELFVENPCSTEECHPSDGVQNANSNDPGDGVVFGIAAKELAEDAGFAVVCSDLGLVCAGPLGAILGGAVAIGWTWMHTPSEKGPMWFYALADD